MALDADALIDRRRLNRRLSVWRGLAILFVLAALIGGAVVLSGGAVGRDHVARLPLRGALLSDRPLVELIEKLGKNDRVAAVVLSIDSPGGTSVGGERLYEALRKLAGKKPLVAHINTLGASAAYMAALASDHIVAHRTSLTGSIGVLIQYGQVNELLDDLGIVVAKVESGPLKAEPSPFQPTTPEAVAVLQSVVDDSFEWFLDLLEERRELERPEARRLADGRIYTGNQAYEAGLIDAIGGEDAAVKYLVDERGITANLPLRTYKPADSTSVPLFARMADRLVDRLLGAAGIALPPMDRVGSVDGLWSLWHGYSPVDTRILKND